jgi:benzylsuccinate CoA-transferase BbsF subunit
MAAQMVGPADAPRPWDRSTSYHMTNRNKLGICMNVLDPRGKELFLRLISIADAFVIGYSAGTATQMGIDYRLIQHKPDLVMLSSVAWGERGPYQGYSTIGAGPDAWAGHHHLRAYPDQDASTTRQSVHLDASVAVTIGFAVLSALHYRDRTGKGQFIDLSMGEVLLNHLARPALDWVMNNRVDKPIGNVDSDCAPNGCYPCSEPDSWVTIVVRTDEQWRALKKAAGNPAWADDLHLDSVIGRIRAREEIDARLPSGPPPSPPMRCLSASRPSGCQQAPSTTMMRQLSTSIWWRAASIGGSPIR